MKLSLHLKLRKMMFIFCQNKKEEQKPPSALLFYEMLIHFTHQARITAGGCGVDADGFFVNEWE